MALPRPSALQGKLEEVQAREAVQSAPPGYLGLALGERVSVRHIGLGDDQGFSYGTAKLLKSSREIWVHWGLRGSIPDGVHSTMTPRDMSRREDNLPLPSTRCGVFPATPLHAGGRNGAHGSYSALSIA